jgi:ATP-binding cassette subfamily E protein 1
MFDEPSSFLDVRQRLNAALCIRSLVTQENYVICVEHDLAVLDYLSDFICCLYGEPGVYGVVTLPFNVRDGINHFLKGFIPTENMRFRNYELSFNMVTQTDNDVVINTSQSDKKKKHIIQYPTMTKTLSTEKTKGGGPENLFKLNVQEGFFTHSEIVVLLGQNGTGKTTFIRMFAGLKDYEPDSDIQLPQLNISHKPQTITPSFEGTVRELLQTKIKDSFFHTQFQTDVFKPLELDKLLDMKVGNLSGGELQRVAITLCLGKPADVYLIDEPSAYLDAEQRINAAKVIKRFIMHTRKTAFVVEHDFIMATYLADKVILFDGIPSIECTAHTPQSLLDGMNSFLKQLNITFRRDPTNWRPRINKQNSVKDSEQKLSGNYFFLESN